MLRTHAIRSDEQLVRTATATSKAIWTNTKEASPTTTLVPMPVLTFGVVGTGSVTLPGSKPVVPKPLAERVQTSHGAGEPLNASLDEPPNASLDKDEAVIARLQHADLDDGVANREPEQQVGMEPLLDDGSSGAAAAVSSADVHQNVDAESSSRSEAHTMEVSIDSLPHIQVMEAIPVTVRSLGDRLVTASVDALNLSSTGDTLGDALITVKEQIELLYERLTKNSRLDEDEENQLGFLRRHVKSSEDPIRHRRLHWR